MGAACCCEKKENHAFTIVQNTDLDPEIIQISMEDCKPPIYCLESTLPCPGLQEVSLD